MRIFCALPLLSLALALAAAGCDSSPSERSKEDVRQQAAADGKADDATDWCEIFDWYGDGECDEFCLSPDSDCGSDDGCFVGGCSGQVCSDQPGVITTCEFQQHFACFQTAACERQADGACGWTEDEELTQCLDSFLGFCPDGTEEAGASDFVASTDGMECELPVRHCLTDDLSACPQIHPLSPDFCADGTVFHGEPTFVSSVDGMECSIPSIHCLTDDLSACPQIHPLSPDFCADGTIVQGPPTFVPSTDGKECQIPSVHCVTDDASACPQL